jgi:hypothetical protein
LLQFLKLEFYKILGVLDNHWKTIGVRTGNLILVSRLEQDFLTISTGKRKHDEISSGYFIPQRDGAADDELSTSMGEACQNVVGLLLSTSQKINRNKNKNVIRTCYYRWWSWQYTVAPKLISLRHRSLISYQFVLHILRHEYLVKIAI